MGRSPFAKTNQPKRVGLRKKKGVQIREIRFNRRDKGLLEEIS